MFRSRWLRRMPIALAACTVLLGGVSTEGAAVASAQTGAATTGGTTREISSAGTASFAAGSSGASAGSQGPETAGAADGAIAPNRSHSSGARMPVGAVSQPKSLTTSNPGLVASFDALNHFQNRFGSTAGVNQF